MSISDAKQHMSSDEIAKAVVDREALTADRRAHLRNCRICSEALADFEDQLSGIGRAARKTAPAPSRPFRLPQTRTVRHWQRKPILAMGIAALVLLAVVVWTPTRMSPPAIKPVASFDAAEDQRLMEDIDDIVDNALPEIYQELAIFDMPDLTDDDMGDDDPSDWIVPSLQEDEDGDFLS